MALVKKIVWDNRNIGWKSQTVCSVRARKVGGEMYLQLNSYGSRVRKVKGQSSQALTFDEKTGIFLRDILITLFPLEYTDSLQNPNTTQSSLDSLPIQDSLLLPAGQK